MITSKYSFFAKILEGKLLNYIKTSKKILDAKTENEYIDIKNIQDSFMKLDELVALEMENFYKELKTLIPFIKLDNIFNVAEKVDIVSDDSPIFVLDGFDAQMKKINNIFVVLEGSKCKKEWNAKNGYKKEREELINKSVLKKYGTHYTFQVNYEYDYSSEPASIITANSISGPSAYLLNYINVGRGIFYRY